MIINCTITRQRAGQFMSDPEGIAAHVDFPKVPTEPITASGQVERRRLKVPVGTDIQHGDTIMFTDPPDPFVYRVIGIRERSRLLFPRIECDLEGRRA